MEETIDLLPKDFRVTDLDENYCYKRIFQKSPLLEEAFKKCILVYIKDISLLKNFKLFEYIMMHYSVVIL